MNSTSLYSLVFGNPMALNRYLRIMYIKKELKKIHNAKILDIGCSDGHFTSFLSGRKNKVYAVDIVNNKEVNNYSGIKFILCDGQKLSFPDSCFDFIFCSDVFEHVVNYDKIINEISRTLKPGGQCLISTVEGYWKSPIPIRKFFISFPESLRQSILKEFNTSDANLHGNFLGHINLQITLDEFKNKLIIAGLKIVKETKYCYCFGSFLMELFYSFNLKLRYCIFPILKFLLPLDKIIKNKYYWQFYVIGQKPTTNKNFMV